MLLHEKKNCDTYQYVLSKNKFKGLLFGNAHQNIYRTHNSKLMWHKFETCMCKILFPYSDEMKVIQMIFLTVWMHVELIQGMIFFCISYHLSTLSFASIKAIIIVTCTNKRQDKK